MINYEIFLLLTMLFMHIVDDYYLQGILASMKRKDWWLESPSYNHLYKDDYKIALIEHAYSWTFIVNIPVIIFLLVFKEIGIWYYVLFILNIVVHALTDELKANKKAINLVTDQLIHIFQIVATWLIVILV